MFDFVFILFLLVFFFAVASPAIARIGRASKKGFRNATRSSDGHVVPRKDDLTCETKYGHRHAAASEKTARYIVHEEPNEGYVILNGVKRKLSDCRNL